MCESRVQGSKLPDEGLASAAAILKYRVIILNKDSVVRHADLREGHRVCGYSETRMSCLHLKLWGSNELHPTYRIIT